MNWFDKWIEQQEMTCVRGKKPSSEKVISFCRRAESDNGCPNLVPVSAQEAKPGTTFGKRTGRKED